MKNVSVIVPVYNVEQYLRECVESILSQTLKPYEIILVDDGSTDSCGEICDLYDKNYRLIHTIHKSNGGMSSARNKGIEVANGDYILFCDSDDCLKENALEQLCKPLHDEDLDIVMCGYTTFPNGQTVLPDFPYNVVLKGKDLVRYNKRIHSHNDFCFSWRFLLNNNFIKDKDLQFNEGIKIGEDFLFNTMAIMEAESCLVLDQSLYLYRINNQNSIMRTKYKPNLENDLTEQYKEKIKISEKYGLMENEDWKNDLAFYYVNSFRDMLFRNLHNGPKSINKRSIQKILNLDLIKDNYKRLGNKIYSGSKRAALFHFCCKYKLVGCVYYFLRKEYN